MGKYRNFISAHVLGKGQKLHDVITNFISLNYTNQKVSIVKNTAPWVTDGGRRRSEVFGNCPRALGIGVSRRHLEAAFWQHTDAVVSWRGKKSSASSSSIYFDRANLGTFGV